MLIRQATDADLDTILVIYNAAIVETAAIWTDEVVDRHDRELWLNAHRRLGHPVFVAVIDDEVVGYASFAPWRAKYGYRYSVEDSVYIAGGHQGEGIGTALMVALIARAKADGMHLMVADIEAGNAASIALHEKLGFVRTGLITEIGTKFDRWLDLAIMQLRLED